MNDTALLAACPEFVAMGGMLKASPAEEGGKRVIYFEASNEGIDQQNEVVAAKALAESADYFKRYGNIDIDHYTMIGPRLGIPDHGSYEIGRPVDVRQTGKSTFVKAEIYAGDGPAANRANHFWSSLTDINPPARWYPSVAGPVLEKAIEVDPKSGSRHVVFKKVRWTNVGMSRTPVNQHVGTCATVPVEVFAKALVAGYGTDSAALTGGAALRGQSLDGVPANYFDFRHRISTAFSGRVKSRLVKGEGDALAREMTEHAAKHFGMSHDDAAEHVVRLFNDMHRTLKGKK